MKIKYRELKSYKYELAEDYIINIGNKFGEKVQYPKQNPYIILDKNGDLIIKKGYAWDGPSGPTIDTKNFMRGSLVHDALYQLMRKRLLPQLFRLQADEILYRICKEDGMSRFRAIIDRTGLALFGASAARPTDELDEQDKILEAP